MLILFSIIKRLVLCLISKAKEYKFDKDDRDEISVDDCTKQLEKWAEKQAEQYAETTEQGKRLSYLKLYKLKLKTW